MSGLLGRVNISLVSFDIKCSGNKNETHKKNQKKQSRTMGQIDILYVHKLALCIGTIVTICSFVSYSLDCVKKQKRCIDLFTRCSLS